MLRYFLPQHRHLEITHLKFVRCAYRFILLTSCAHKKRVAYAPNPWHQGRNSNPHIPILSPPPSLTPSCQHQIPLRVCGTELHEWKDSAVGDSFPRVRWEISKRRDINHGANRAGAHTAITRLLSVPSVSSVVFEPADNSNE